ncbi:hypothetical protein RRG08_020900 [Elysia crispata]|uniref:Uncharacterized protein n=1 Tax=Elysia crispata TaxID=231223 RepID=A0AAE1DA01_9GAST|nr:hypothetical protein RRG08_020900 [Elysia crispata]
MRFLTLVMIVCFCIMFVTAQNRYDGAGNCVTGNLCKSVIRFIEDDKGRRHCCEKFYDYPLKVKEPFGSLGVPAKIIRKAVYQWIRTHFYEGTSTLVVQRWQYG